jgi:hypothetical protein
MATGVPFPFLLTVDSTSVYWVSSQGPDGGPGSLMKCPIDAGADDSGSPDAGNIVTLYSDVSNVTGIATDSTNVYWASASYGVSKCSVNGCGTSATLIAYSDAKGIAIDSANIYWIDRQNQLVETCPLAGCPAGPEGGVSPAVLAQGLHQPSNIVIDANSFYWIDSSEVAKCPLTGCPNGGSLPEVLSPTQNGGGLSVDATNVYWTVEPPQILACAVGGCGETPVVLANASGFNTATDGINLYWNNAVGGAGGLVQKCAIGGCAQMPTSVASGINTPTGIAVDSKAIYWTSDVAGGSIMRVAK